MVELAGMAEQVRLNVAQAPQAEQLRQQHRNQMRLGLQRARIAVRFVFLLKAIHSRPRNMLQKFMKHDILVPHGFGPFSCPVDSQTAGSE
jgi:hypothetical protein